MRSKVYLIRGWLNLSKAITIAEFERINVEHVLLITALRRPQFLPHDTDMDPNSITINYKKIMEHWRATEQDHLLISEYASFAIDRKSWGEPCIKAVEGDPLYVQWFYEAVRAMHKHFGQTIVDVEILRDSRDDKRVRIEDNYYTLTEALERLSPSQFLG